MNKYVERIYNGVWKENPSFVQMLGLCPTLAVTTSATNGVGMGLSTTAVLVAANFLVSALRNIILHHVDVVGVYDVRRLFARHPYVQGCHFLPSGHGHPFQLDIIGLSEFLLDPVAPVIIP